MKFPLFRRTERAAAIRQSEDRAEQLLADGLRLLSQLCAKMADYVEAQRSMRSGGQERFLERVDRRPPDDQ